MFGWEYWCGGFWWFFPLFMLIMIIGCIFMMHRSHCMGKWMFPTERNRSLEDSAEEILKKRYALGEIDHSQYEEMLRNISKTRS